MEYFTDIVQHLPPLLGILLYLSYPKSLRIPPSLLYWLSVAHNGFLVVFSGWTFISLVQIIQSDGVVVQSGYYFQNPRFDAIFYYFYLSKYYEFFDTFLLYLNGKTPIFLQKYHHVGAVIFWHLSYVYKLDAGIVTTVNNSFIHTIMYLYYLGSLLKIRQVRFIKQYITSLQIIQFFGALSVLYLYFPPVESVFNYSLIVSAQMYTFGLIYLFGQFYYRNYVNKAKNNEEKRSV